MYRSREDKVTQRKKKEKIISILLVIWTLVLCNQHLEAGVGDRKARGMNQRDKGQVINPT